MSQVAHEVEQRWALGEPVFEDELRAGADIVESFAAAQLLDTAEAALWRTRFERALRGPLRWPPPRPEVRARALGLLRGLVDAPEERRPMGIVRYCVEMNLITARDAAELEAELYPGAPPEPDRAREVVAVGVEQPRSESRLDVVWIMRSTTGLTIRWRLRGIQLEPGNPDVEPPPDQLATFELHTTDGNRARAAGGAYRGSASGFEGTIEFVPAPPPGPSTLRFGDDERTVTIP
jgi:hypothetical protein